MSEEKKFNRNFLEAFALTLIGLGLLMFAAAGYSYQTTVLFLVFGIGASLGGAIIMLDQLRLSEKHFKKNKSGALYIWAVCLLSLVVLAMGWFTLTYPTFMIIDLIEDIYDFPSQATAAIGLIKSVLGWFLILMALGLIIWAFVASSRREDVTYPIA